jgi:hypothetical protein
MKYKISVELNEQQYQGFRAILGVIGAMKIVPMEEGGEEIIKEVVKPERSTVRYQPKMELTEALKDLGDKTIAGLVYSYLVEAGPRSCKEVHVARPFKHKTIESVLYQLKVKGFVDAISMIDQVQEVPHVDQSSGSSVVTVG